MRLESTSQAFLVVLAFCFLLAAAGGCGSFEIGIQAPGTPADGNAAATVSALITENARLSMRIATLEATRQAAATAAPAVSATVAVASATPAVAASPTAAATATPPPATAIASLSAPAVTSTPAVTATTAPPVATAKATASPAATPLPCRTASSDQERTLAVAFPGLGCPTASEQPLYMGRQAFEHGQMIWRSDFLEIFVLYADGSWQSLPDEWRDGQPESDPTLVAPPGLQQPARGFGKAWREQLGGAAARTGWATEKERGLDGFLGEWERGIVVRFGTESLALLDNGTWQRRW